jgi:RNA polymerase sigma-70 factor (ECF subfamily)
VNCCREIQRTSGGQAPSPVQTNETPALRLNPTDVERAIATIAPAAREVFVLHEIYGYTHEEIGDIAGIDAGTSRSQLHHARRTFRTYFEESHGRRTEST